MKRLKKKKWQAVEFEIIYFSTQDTIMTSGMGDYGFDGPDDDWWGDGFEG